MSCIMATTVALAVFCSVACCTKITDENLARQWLREYDVRGGKLINEASVAEWNYVTNLTEYNQKQTVRMKATSWLADLHDWAEFALLDQVLKQLFPLI